MTANDSTDRVQAALELLGVLGGGGAPDPARVLGLTADERASAEDLFAAGLEASLPGRRVKVARMVFLLQHAPGLSIGDAINSLTPAQLAEYEALDDRGI